MTSVETPNIAEMEDFRSLSGLKNSQRRQCQAIDGCAIKQLFKLKAYTDFDFSMNLFEIGLVYSRNVTNEASNIGIKNIRALIDDGLGGFSPWRTVRCCRKQPPLRGCRDDARVVSLLNFLP